MPATVSLSDSEMCWTMARALVLFAVFFMLTVGAMSFGLAPESIGGMLA